MSNQLILAVDQGTGSTKGLLFNEQLEPVASASVALGQTSPEPGWVEQDPNEILAGVLSVMNDLAGFDGDILGLALTNQRESAIAWSTETGETLSSVLGWQDRRTASDVAGFSREVKARVRDISGLPLDPMFSALKLRWILDQIDSDRSLSSAGKIAVGTVDSWLLFKLTGEHRIEVGNASRTQLLDVQTGAWSAELLEFFNIPAAALPRVTASNEPSGEILAGPLAGKRVLAVLADSHAALFAHGGEAKATFGTGSSVMATGRLASAESGLVSTIAWGLAVDPNSAFSMTPAVEGNILSSGSTLVWLAGILDTTPEELARAAKAGRSGINLVPAFGGLGAPWWQADAQAALTGMTLDTTREDIAYAAFESLVLQVEDVLAAVDSIGEPLSEIFVDGGPTANEWLMQLLADLSQRKIIRANIAELSALGVAAFAGLHSGLWQAPAATPSQIFEPKLTRELAIARRQDWHQAINQTTLKGAHNG